MAKIHEDFKAVVGKTIFSDGKGKLFFGYYKEDDSVHFVDYKTWKKLSFKDVSKGNTNKERVIKAILKNQKQFNKKVDFNMWAKKNNPSFEQTMDWFIQNGWINNINKGGIKESTDILSVNELQYKDAVAKFNDELIKHPMVKKAAQHYKKTPVEIVKVLQQRLSTKGNRGGDTKEVSIDFKDTTSGITIKHSKKFNESVNERVWTPEQERQVALLDSQFRKYLSAKGIEPTSIEASNAWKKYGFQDKMRKIFGKAKYESVTEGKKVFKVNPGIGNVKYSISSHDGVKKHKDGSDFFDIKTFKNKVDLEKAIKDYTSKGFKMESVTESAGKEAMGIAAFTGTRGDAVQKFIDTHKINAGKLFNFVKKGKLSDRMEFVTALAGRDGNPIQKKIIKMFGESVTEAVKPSQVRSVISRVKKDLMKKWKQKGGYENFGDKEGDMLRKKFNFNPYGSSEEREIAKMIQSFEDWAMNYDGNMREAKFGYKDSTASYIKNHNNEYKVAEKMNKGNEMKFYDDLQAMEDKIGHPKFMIFVSNALRGYGVDMYKDPKIKNPQDAQEALFLLSK